MIGSLGNQSQITSPSDRNLISGTFLGNTVQVERKSSTLGVGNWQLWLPCSPQLEFFPPTETVLYDCQSLTDSSSTHLHAIKNETTTKENQICTTIAIARIPCTHFLLEFKMSHDVTPWLPQNVHHEFLRSRSLVVSQVGTRSPVLWGLFPQEFPRVTWFDGFPAQGLP